MTREQMKQVFISIMVGACVAFFSTLFSALAEFLKAHSTEIVSGGVTAMYHMTKTFKV